MRCLLFFDSMHFFPLAAKLIGRSSGLRGVNSLKMLIFCAYLPLSLTFLLREGIPFFDIVFVGLCEVFMFFDSLYFSPLAAKLIGLSSGR